MHRHTLPPRDEREGYYQALNAEIGDRHGLHADQAHAIRSLWVLHHDRMKIVEWAARNLSKDVLPRGRGKSFYQQILNTAAAAFEVDWADLVQPDQYQEETKSVAENA